MELVSRASTVWTDLKGIGRFLSEAPKFIPSGSWNAGKLLEQNAARIPGHTALRFMDESYSWAELNARANQYADFFAKQGIGPGDVVALIMDNRSDFVFIELGLSKLRAVSALLNHNLTGKALTHAINVGCPKLVVVGSEHAHQVREVLDTLELINPRRDACVQRESDEHDVGDLRVINDEVERCTRHWVGADAEPKTADPMNYIYTSGTTGLPKAAIITNQRFMMAASLFGRTIHEAEPGDAIYVALPLYHSNAQWAGLAGSLMTGATLALRRKFSATNFWNDVHHFGATHFAYIGEVCRYLLNQPRADNERNHSVRVATGNGLRPDIWEEFQRRFGIPMIREFYGATEGNAPMVNVGGRPGMVGRIRPGQYLVRCDLATGEVIRNGKGLCEEIEPGQTGLLLGRINRVTKFDGYVDSAATKKKIIEDVFKKGDTYFNSGDLLTLHDNKWVSFADRVGDTFRWKGENVSTNEVAEILNACPGILESNVYGVQVPGKEGRCGMASLNVSEQFDIARLASFVVDKMPGYQRPYFVRVQRDMRVTGTFKHQKVDYRKEGFDPDKVGNDLLYFLDRGHYVPIDAELYAKLRSGEVEPA